MKKILILFALITIYNFTSNVDDCKSQWVQQYFVGNYNFLYAIQFANNNTGYIVGGLENGSDMSVFLKTTNGGNDWVRIMMNLSLESQLYSLSFINENTGYVCGRTSNIRKTTDGGQTWVSYMAATNTPNLSAIQFLNEQTGYVGGRYGYRAKSTNGGINWTALDTAYAHIDVIHFFDVNTGIMGDANSGIYRTTNGGANWSFKYQTDTLGRGYDYVNSSFINENTGYFLGTTYNTGILIKTTNKGIDWNIVRTFTTNMGGVFALTSSTVYVTGYWNYIMCSTNSGTTWSNQIFSSTPRLIYSVCFLNNNTGFACGVDGNVYRTTNGGVRVENISTETPSKYSLSQNYPNPFNPITKIRFDIANGFPVKTSGNDKVVLKVYDIMGREVQTLVNERLQPGTYEATFDGSMLNSGVYFYKLTTDGFTETKKMLMIK